MKSICLIIPYFGKFKNYFPLFLTSCQFNTTVNWLIETDSREQYEWPKNVRVIKSSFNLFKKIVQMNFNFDISLDTPYKLCDYKPAYGEIFKNELEGYDFWGHCDCDLIFGDIRRFLPDEILKAYNKIFTRGHLTMYHNDPETNSFYRSQNKKDYKQVYQNPENAAFDEWAGISGIWEQSGRGYYDAMPFDDIISGLDGLYPTKRYGKKVIGGPYHELNEDESERFQRMKHITYYYEKGKLYRLWIENNSINKEEVLYVHLQKRNMDIRMNSLYADKF